MAHTLPNVTVTIDNNRLGRIAPSEDGVSGLIVSGAAAGSFALGDVLEGNSLADFEAMGIDASYDVVNSAMAWKHISDFYSWKENAGLKLYVMVVDKTVLMSQLVNQTNANYAKKMLIAANGRIRLLGVTRLPQTGYAPTYAGQFDQDIFKAAANAQLLYEDEFALHRPVQIMLEGYDWQGNASSSLNTRDEDTGLNANRVSIIMGQDNDVPTTYAWAPKHAFLGLFLGRVAAIPVNVDAGRVADGKLPIINHGFSNGSLVNTYTDANLDTLDDYGYIFGRTFTGFAGIYFNDDHTCSPYTDDALYISHCRPLDKVARICWLVYVREILGVVQVDAVTGKLAAATAKHYQGILAAEVNKQMTSAGEIIAIVVFVDLNQNVLVTDKIDIQADVTKTGTSRHIAILLGFKATA